jgi:hypothetical protein
MAGVMILIVRHAEKPASGAELSPAGSARAAAYARYFNPFNNWAGESITPDLLIASTDTTKSDRPELTLKPLSAAIGLPIDTHFANHEEKALAEALRSTAHGKHILIAWSITTGLAHIGGGAGHHPPIIDGVVDQFEYGCPQMPSPRRRAACQKDRISTVGRPGLVVDVSRNGRHHRDRSPESVPS